jgi:simple sugar transport system ATP-binding protein
LGVADIIDSSADKNAPAIELEEITKSFGPIRANDGIGLRVERGSVHAIIGENGAGKSTLMNILYGIYRPDRGQIKINGVPCAFQSPADAHHAGIGMVHQHFKLVEPFTVLDNVLLGFEDGAVLSRPRQVAASKLEAIERDYGLSVPLGAVVDQLPVGMRQRVEILKALYRSADILILDEPTGVLTPVEVEQLFQIIERLKGQGKTILFISHKLGEVMRIADRISVMRGGRLVADRDPETTNTSELAELMIGQKLGAAVDRKSLSAGQTLLQLENISLAPAEHSSGLHDISLKVRSGEIIGIAGVTGNGQSELLEIIGGLRVPASGKMTLGAEVCAAPDMAPGSLDLRKKGIGFVAEDRLRMGAVGSMTATENIILGYHGGSPFSRRGRLQRQAMHDACARIMAENDVRPQTPGQTMATFSGGNQQKLVFGRETDHDPRLFFLGEPTRGVDIGAVQRIHNTLISMRNSGGAVLVVSSDLDELLAICDRILVMFEGRIVGETLVAGVDIASIGLMMAGQKPGEPAEELQNGR